MAQGDTIAAIATPTGRGGVGIVRISGPATARIAAGMLGNVPQPRYATFARFRREDGSAIDEGIALFFPSPASYTGEDVLELQGHGGVVVMDLLLERATQLGARLARPGEFTERAFLNDKLDLAQAEAVADLIDSASAAAARSAMASLDGEFSRQVDGLVEAVTLLRMYVEAAIDFPEEEVDFLADDSVTERLKAIQSQLQELARAAGSGVLLAEGIEIALAGKPNAGKSSLMNRFSGRDTSIVTSVPGTTRDVVTESVNLRGVPVRFVDTAGLRDSDDLVEQEGVRRTVAAVARAHHTLIVIDANATGSDPRRIEAELRDVLSQLDAGEGAATVVLNKVDLADVQSWPETVAEFDVVAVSAQTGAGFDALIERIAAAVGFDAEAGTFTARRRHLTALTEATDAVARGMSALTDTGAGELLAEELRLAQDALGEITGVFTADDLLGRIFSSFCIGK